jgi:hypothetical protein
MRNNAGIENLDARVTAIEMIVEAMFVDYLAEDEDPETIGEEMVKRAFAREAKAREKFPDQTAYAMKIAGAVSAFVDRAVKRAIDQRRRRPRSSP